MNDVQRQEKPIAVVEGRSTVRYAEDRPSLANLTPVQANRIMAAMLHIAGMDHLREGKEIYRQSMWWLPKGDMSVGPEILVRPANFSLKLETYFNEILKPVQHASGEFHSLIAGLGQYALASIGQSDVRETDIRRLAPVFAGAWETIDEAKRSEDANVSGLAEVLDAAIHEGLSRGTTKRNLVAR